MRKFRFTIFAACTCFAQTPVPFERILNARSEPRNWLTYWGNYQGQHFSSLSQITPANVNQLQARWSVPMPVNSIPLLRSPHRNKAPGVSSLLRSLKSSVADWPFFGQCPRDFSASARVRMSSAPPSAARLPSSPTAIVNVDGVAGSDGVEALLVQSAKDFGLRLQAHVAYFVENARSKVS